MTTTDDIHVADLEPSLVDGRTYVTRRRITYVDAATLLGAMVVLITLIPARLIVPGMTDLARPGLIVGFALFCWWILVRFAPHLVMTGPQPVRWAVLVFMLSVIVSYAAGFMRGLTTMEANAADRMLLYFCVFSGVVLTAADGIPNWIRLRSVLKVLVVCAPLVAVIALLQYVLAIDVTQYMIIPGLAPNGWTIGFENRGGGIRVASTTTHYIELAAFLALVLPFAIHFSLFSRRRWRKRFALLATGLIVGGIATTISRTGILAVGLMFAVLFPLWSWRMRYNIAAVGLGLLAALAAASPGLVNTLLHLFSDLGQNSSIQARSDRFPMIFHYFYQHPWLGRGTGTWVSPQYQVLDNQWFGFLLTNGVVGVAVLLTLHTTGIALAWLALRRSSAPEDRHLCAALISTQVIGIVAAGTFDSLYYSTYSTVLALTLGFCGAVWRLTHPARTVRTSTTRWFLDRHTPSGVPAQAPPAE